MVLVCLFDTRTLQCTFGTPELNSYTYLLLMLIVCVPWNQSMAEYAELGYTQWKINRIKWKADCPAGMWISWIQLAGLGFGLANVSPGNPVLLGPLMTRLAQTVTCILQDVVYFWKRFVCYPSVLSKTLALFWNVCAGIAYIFCLFNLAWFV